MVTSSLILIFAINVRVRLCHRSNLIYLHNIHKSRNHLTSLLLYLTPQRSRRTVKLADAIELHFLKSIHLYKIVATARNHNYFTKCISLYNPTFSLRKKQPQSPNKRYLSKIKLYVVQLFRNSLELIKWKILYGLLFFAK